MTFSNTNQSKITASVDNLVRDITQDKIHFDKLKSILDEVYVPFMSTLDFDLFYSEPIIAFIESTNAIVGDLYPSDVIWSHENVERLINALLCYKKDIEKEDIAWRYQESQNYKSLDSYIKNLTTHYSKLLFIRVDLKYSDGLNHLVTVEDFSDHMTKLRELISHRQTCFEDLQGFAWAIEQGYENGGLHCHLLLIYNGSTKQKDFYLAKEVGEKWTRMTAGLGAYYNYHSKEHKRRYQRHGKLGIGMIHRDNELEVENASRTALYLTEPKKYSQQLKVWLPNMRTFGHGIYRTSKRRGLPPIPK